MRLCKFIQKLGFFGRKLQGERAQTDRLNRKELTAGIKRGSLKTFIRSFNFQELKKSGFKMRTQPKKAEL